VNVAGVRNITPVPLTGTWYRAIQPQFWSTLLQTSHTRASPSRFNAGVNQFEAFYLAENHLVALQEVGALVGTPSPGGLFPLPHRAWSVINVAVHLTAVADLTRHSQRSLVGTNAQELTGDWRSYAVRHQVAGRPGSPPLAPTQRLGAELFGDTRFEALKTYSAKQPFSAVLVVFPQRLASSSRVIFRDPVSKRPLSLP